MKKIRMLLQSRRTHLIIIILVTLLAYVNILQNGFAWDDRDFFLEWPQIKNTNSLPAYLSLPDLLKGDLPLEHRGVYRPIRSIYYLVSFAVWKENPLGYHIQALIVHTLIVLVIYLITELITKKRPLALIVALLFATHPIHTEAVTYTAASMDTLGILFFFLSFYLYLKIKKERYKKRIYLITSLIYASLAFLTYEMTLVLPLLIVLYDFCANKLSFKKIIPKINTYKNYFFLLFGYILIRFVILQIGNRADYLGIGWAVAANQARVGIPEILRDYLSWLIWPSGLTISHDVSTQLLLKFLDLLNRVDPTGRLVNLSASISFLFPILYVLAGITLIYFCFKKYPWIFFGIVWVIISLVPVFNIIPQGETLAERFLYISSFGFTLLLGSAFYYGLSTLKKNKNYRPLMYMLLAILPIFIAFYTYQTILRNQDWKDEKTIWLSAIKLHPDQPRPYKVLAMIYDREGQYDQAINLYKTTMDLTESDATLNSSLGLIYAKKGDINNAKIQYQKALAINPKYYLAYVYLGNIYLEQKEYKLAEKEYQNALNIKENDPLILSYLGSVYFNTREYDKAIQAFHKSIEFNPKQPKVYLGLVNAYEQKGNIQKAIEILKQGLNINQDDTLYEKLNSLLNGSK